MASLACSVDGGRDESHIDLSAPQVWRIPRHDLRNAKVKKRSVE